MRKLSSGSFALFCTLGLLAAAGAAADDSSYFDTPAPAAPDAIAAPQGTAQEDYGDVRIPRYTLTRPTWGIQVAGSPKVFPGIRGTGTSFDTATIKGASLQVDYQPPGIQKYGIFGIGPSLAVYPAPSGVTKKAWNLWSAGLQVRYQARYFREQPLVPMVGYQMEYWNYVVAGRSGRMWVKGPSLGVGLLLNWFDRPAAATFYTEQGISRTYLIAEMRQMSGSDLNLALKGTSYFFGLRFEL